MSIANWWLRLLLVLVLVVMVFSVCSCVHVFYGTVRSSHTMVNKQENNTRNEKDARLDGGRKQKIWIRL